MTKSGIEIGMNKVLNKVRQNGEALAKKINVDSLDDIITQSYYMQIGDEGMHDSKTHEVFDLDGVNAIKPNYYGDAGKDDLIAKWHNTAPNFETFAFAMYTHIDKYVYRHLGKNGIQDLEKAEEYIRRLKEYESIPSHLEEE